MRFFSKILGTLLCPLMITSCLLFSPKTFAMNPKAKVMIAVSAYGATGGALLGFASMAFGSPSKTIFKGASLGLYAGILFGAYILASHSFAQPMETPYEDAESPYESEGSSGGYSSEDEESTKSKLYERSFQLNQFNLVKNTNHQGIPPISLDLLSISF